MVRDFAERVDDHKGCLILAGVMGGEERKIQVNASVYSYGTHSAILGNQTHNNV